MKDYDADTYINRFIELADAAQWDLDAAGIISTFRDGLPVNIHQAAATTQPADMVQRSTNPSQNLERPEQ